MTLVLGFNVEKYVYWIGAEYENLGDFGQHLTICYFNTHYASKAFPPLIMSIIPMTHQLTYSWKAPSSLIMNMVPFTHQSNLFTVS